MKTFHAPSFGDEDFDVVTSMSVMQQPMSHHQMDQYQMQQQGPPSSANHNYGDSQYGMWQPDTQQMYMNNTNTYEQPLDPQMNAYGVYGNDQGQLHNQNHTMPPSHMQTMSPTMQYQLPTQNHHHLLNHQQQQQQPPPQQQQSPAQQTAQNQQMFMMPPPYKSPSMTPQSQHQIMSSPTVNQSPHYIGPGENGTTSEDSDDSGLRGVKRPSPEPLNESPSKVGKASAVANAAKKPKAQRKKKKKDPNEPQKPVSAYALFFRDTQSAIKGKNPNATFGEVSTIVASMWDTLELEHKDVYKKKQEAAKKDYLKTLAVYRASAVSKGSDAENSSASGAMSPAQSQVPSSQASQSSLPVPQQPLQSVLKQEPQIPSMQSVIKQESQIPSMQSVLKQEPQIPSMQSPGQHSLHPQSPVLQQNNTPPQFIHQQSQSPSMQAPQNTMHLNHNAPTPPHQQYIPNSYKSPPQQSNQIDYGQMHHPSHQMGLGRSNHNNSQQHYGYEQPPPHQMAHNNMVPMDPYNMNQSPNHANLQVQHQTSPMHQHPGQQQQQQQHHLQQQQQQQHHHHHHQPPPNNNMGHCDNNLGASSSPYNQNYANTNTCNSLSHQQHAPAPIQCIRNGCTNLATHHPDWEDEYCSSECVVYHCRNVFTNWVQGNNSTQQLNNSQQNFSVVK